MKSASAGALAVASSALVGLISWVSLPAPRSAPASEPGQHRSDGYLGSGACKACHATEYKSWKGTYHRSMTRTVKELAWDGRDSPQLPVELNLDGRQFRIERSDRGIFVFGPDLHRFGRLVSRIARLDASTDELRERADHAFQEVPTTQAELSLVTGSHHYLAFWVGGGADKELRQLPFVFRLEERKFLPRREAFLQPPNALPQVSRWNSNCIQCHSLAGRPQQSEGHDEITGQFWEKYGSDVAELGISCESCHGPGAKHADHFRDPLRRHGAKTHQEAPAAYIQNPARLSQNGDQNVCGQCHSYFLPDDPATWWVSGFSKNYRAGDHLSESRTILRASPKSDRERRSLEAVSAHRNSLFWEDGSMIVGGREYNGLIESPCFEHGQGERKLTCTSCHTMHQGAPNDQLAPEFQNNSDNMCTQCHSHMPKTHTQHAPESVGSRCVNCHMPKTSYALLSAIRSHRITSPAPASTSPPNGCALCHVDRTQGDLDSQLARYLTRPVKTIPTRGELPWAAQQALSGNAAVRAVFAHALGTKEARAASGTALSAQLLDVLKKDSYAAIRHIATQSASKIRGPTSTTGTLPRDAIKTLVRSQDPTPIVISE